MSAIRAGQVVSGRVLSGIVLSGLLLAACAVAEGSSSDDHATPGSSVRSDGPSTPERAPTSVAVPPTTTSTTAPPPPFPRFEPAEYGLLLDAIALPDAVVVGPQPITGDEAADGRIRLLAEWRGYRLRPVAQAPLVSEAGVLVHPYMVGDLRALLDEAHFFGMALEVSSGHRSVGRQRDIFRRELREQSIADLGRELTSGEIASGVGDPQVLEVLRWHSVPGYSRHHSGFAVDFDAGGALVEFEGSPVEEWLRADDFANAKRFGFVPSYPRGSGPQGPDPEPWEFVYVGRGNISCAVIHVPMEDPDAAASCSLLG